MEGDNRKEMNQQREVNLSNQNMQYLQMTETKVLLNQRKDRKNFMFDKNNISY